MIELADIFANNISIKDITSEGWGIEIVCRGRSITAESLRHIEQDVKNLRMNVELYSIEYDKNKESIVLIFLDR
jgi:hypothetical protein